VGWSDFLLLFGFTALIAAGGYIINDLVDTGPDVINKPGKLVISRSITKKSAQWLYVGCLLLSLLAGIYMDLRYQTVLFVMLQPVLSLGLALYSFRLKRLPLTGNLLIAVWSALVPAIFLLFFQSGFALMKTEILLSAKLMLTQLIYAYTVFAFLSSLLREIIKDMEDMEGDRKFGINSTAVALGIEKSKQIALAVALILVLALILCAVFSYGNDHWIIWAYPVFLVLILIYIAWKIVQSREKADYARLSAAIKYFMLAGLLYLLIISFFQI